MPKRERIRIIPLQSERRPLFGCIPTEICRDPRCHDLRPFELAVLATINSIARLVHGDELHKSAREGGRKAIELELLHAEEFKNDWVDVNNARHSGQSRQAPDRYHVAKPHGLRKKPIKLKKAVKLAGQAGYRSAKSNLREASLPTVSFITSRSLLLRAMQMAPATRNRRSLDDALSVLSMPIRISDRLHSPFLSIKRISSDRLTVSVLENWLRRDRSYQTVPLPLPTKSPLATKLLLWLRTIKPKSEKADNRDIGFRKLCEMFDIRETSWIARQAVNNALDHLNLAYLPKLDHEALLQFKIKMPSIYEINPVADGDRVSFFAHQAGTFRYDRLVAARDAVRAEKLAARRKQSRNRVRVRIDTARPEPVPIDEREFKLFLIEKGYPPKIDFDEMTPDDRRELRTLRREFENNAI